MIYLAETTFIDRKTVVQFSPLEQTAEIGKNLPLAKISHYMVLPSCIPYDRTSFGSLQAGPLSVQQHQLFKYEALKNCSYILLHAPLDIPKRCTAPPPEKSRTYSLSNHPIFSVLLQL